MGLKLKFEKIMQKDDSNRVTRNETSITQLVNEIALRVKLDTFNALQGRVENAESSLVLQANEIASKVSQSTHNALANRVESAESSIVQQANQIASKVSQTDYNGNTIASLINQTADQVTIQANRIKLEGLVTANNNFKVLPDGSIEAVNAKLSGSIIATRMSASSNPSLYGEIGVADGYPGLALYDLRYSSNPYFKIMEASSGNAVLMRDKNDVSRIMIYSSGFVFRDADNYNRIEILDDVTRLLSKTGKTKIEMSDTYIRIIKNGTVVASW